MDKIKQAGGKRLGAGRPKGAANKATASVRALAQKYGPAAIKTLSEIMENSESDTARITAAKELLDRAYGKPTPLIEPSLQETEQAGQGQEKAIYVPWDELFAAVRGLDSEAQKAWDEIRAANKAERMKTEVPS